MLGRARDTPIYTFRQHSWIIRLLALGTTITLAQAVLKSPTGSSRAPWWLIAFLIALGLSIPLALLVWDRQRGVHVLDDGIRSVGANGSRFIPWSEIAAFEIDGYVVGSVVV